MIIKETDFILESVSDSKMFDLQLLRTIRPKGGEERQEFKVAGYGLRLDTAMQWIIQHRINVKHGDEALTMKEYLQEYKQIFEEIKKLCLTN